MESTGSRSCTLPCPKGVILSVEDYAGAQVVPPDTTAQHITTQHRDFSIADVRGCLEDPVCVRTKPQGHPHPHRHSYYVQAQRGPKYHRVVSDHSSSPGDVKTAFRTDQIGKFGVIVYVESRGSTP